MKFQHFPSVALLLRLAQCLPQIVITRSGVIGDPFSIPTNLPTFGTQTDRTATLGDPFTFTFPTGLPTSSTTSSKSATSTTKLSTTKSLPPTSVSTTSSTTSPTSDPTITATSKTSITSLTAPTSPTSTTGTENTTDPGGQIGGTTTFGNTFPTITIGGPGFGGFGR